MLRRIYALPDKSELMVTYDADTDLLNVGHRAASYDEWSLPLAVVDSQDDEHGRRGGIGMTRMGALVPLADVIEMMRQAVAAYDNDMAAAAADVPEPVTSVTLEGGETMPLTGDQLAGQ